MKYVASYAEGLGETSLELQTNSYSDSFPMLRKVLLRKIAVDLASPTTAVAAAILTARHCGDVFEFPGVKLGGDHADALRIILGKNISILGVDGMMRTLSTGELDVAIGPAPNGPRPSPADTTPLINVDWSGDFVDPGTRSSRGFVFGAIQTNAGFFAETTRVSIALGLLVGRDRCRNLYVTAASDEGLDDIARALQVIGVSLILQPETSTTVLRKR